MENYSLLQQLVFDYIGCDNIVLAIFISVISEHDESS